MEEDIKWGAPTFMYKGNLATFNPRAKKFVNLTFHTGAEIEDPEGVLEGDAKEARVLRVEFGMCAIPRVARDRPQSSLPLGLTWEMMQ